MVFYKNNIALQYKDNLSIQRGGDVIGGIIFAIIVCALLICSSSSLNWPFDLDTFLGGNFKQFKITNSLKGFNDIFKNMTNPFTR
jgi:hypothetical protein